MRDLPERRPIGPAHNSRTRREGGTRPPATSANNAPSSSVSCSANAAFNTTRQVCQLPTSPSAEPNRLESATASLIGIAGIMACFHYVQRDIQTTTAASASRRADQDATRAASRVRAVPIGLNHQPVSALRHSKTEHGNAHSAQVTQQPQ